MLTPSFNTLHLQYRIWIAALNFDINVIRILNDHLDDMRQSDETGLSQTNHEQEKTLTDFRTTIDELKNELHLAKMQIAAYLRKKDKPLLTDIQLEDHQLISNRYHAFRSRFENMYHQMIVS
jgi:hypothetical protein